MGTIRSLARDPPQSEGVKELLRGRTINRECRVHRLKYWGHVTRRPSDHILKRALHYRVPGKLKISRPCFTWNDCLQRGLRVSRLRDWAQTIGDKKAHNAKCDSLYLMESSDSD